MRLSSERIKNLCRSRGLRLGELLAKAHVSRTAYYSLSRKETVLPRSVTSIDRTLGVAPSRILDDTGRLRLETRKLITELERIMAEHPSASREHGRICCRPRAIAWTARRLRSGWPGCN